MTLEVNATFACNIKCSYCYENPLREAGNFGPKFDTKKVLKVLNNQNVDFTMFGGEPLLLPIKDIEELWKYGFERFKKNGIQTNGLLIKDEHIKLFKKYNVYVGISIDGPEGANLPRCPDDQTKLVQSNIEKLVSNGIIPSLIITLHKFNCIEYSNEFLDWLYKLDTLGIKYARLHLLEDHDSSLVVSQEDLIDTLKGLLVIEKEFKVLKFDLFDEIRNLLQGRNDVGCVWNGCDPLTTPAVQGVGGDGTLSNCPRTNRDGINFRKADKSGRERYIALYNTEQEYNGCKDCRFFVHCKGYCPGTAINGDWRNRTEHCETIKFLFEYLERELIDSGHGVLSARDTEVLTSNFINNCLSYNCLPDGHVDTPHVDWHIDKTFLGVVTKENPLNFEVENA